MNDANTERGTRAGENAAVLTVPDCGICKAPMGVAPCRHLARVDGRAVCSESIHDYLVACREALAFYADPENYHAITIIGDPPCGEFDDDFSSDHGHPDYQRPMPGARARAALFGRPT